MASEWCHRTPKNEGRSTSQNEREETGVEGQGIFGDKIVSSILSQFQRSRIPFGKERKEKGGGLVMIAGVVDCWAPDNWFWKQIWDLVYLPCRNMYIRHESISDMSVLVQPRTKEKQGITKTPILLVEIIYSEPLCASSVNFSISCFTSWSNIQCPTCSISS